MNRLILKNKRLLRRTKIKKLSQNFKYKRSTNQWNRKTLIRPIKKLKKKE